jgi:hypothetical protein
MKNDVSTKLEYCVILLLSMLFISIPSLLYLGFYFTKNTEGNNADFFKNIIIGHSNNLSKKRRMCKERYPRKLN